MNTNHAQIKSRLYLLAQCLAGSKDSQPQVSLLSGGLAGEVLFYAYLYDLFKEEAYFERFSLLFDACIDSLAEQATSSTICDGFTGVMWVIKHLTRLGLLDRQALTGVYELEAYLLDSFAQDQLNKNYDLLHGLLGKGMYFLEGTPGRAERAVLKRITLWMADIAVANGDGLTWPQVDFSDKLPAGISPADCSRAKYNLGMAHGVPSIISFLSKVHRHRIAPHITTHLLEQSVAWLLKQKQPRGCSLYPTIAGAVEESRLAWCYGDLGPALALYHAWQAIAREDYRMQAISIARHAACRTLDQSDVHREVSRGWIDAGFCHGTAGITHIFHRFYQATRLPEFKQSTEYWLDLSLRAAESASVGIGGYLHPRFNENLQQTRWVAEPALLDGAVGVGLVLLSLYDTHLPVWDGLLMTDIHRINTPGRLTGKTRRAYQE